MSDKITNFLAAGIIVAVIVVGPLLSIWSLNTLFDVGVEYNIWSWLAAFWFGLFFYKGGK